MPVLTAAALLVMSAWIHIQAAPTVEIRKYCTDILHQSEAQERNCAGAPQKYTSSSPSVINLLCCLGSLSGIEVATNYSIYLDKSLLFYIVKSVTSIKKEQQVAEYVEQCYQQVSVSHRNLTEEDYVNWLHYPTTCQLY